MARTADHDENAAASKAPTPQAPTPQATASQATAPKAATPQAAAPKATAPQEDAAMATATPSAPESGTPAPGKRTRLSTRRLWIIGVLAALLLAGGLSYYASASPDGLEKVAADHKMDTKVEVHTFANSPLADYQTKDVESPRLSGGLAGVIGVGATLLVGTGFFYVIRRRSPDTGPGDSSATG